jgi:uncharacterized protein (TIGR02301 family)
MNGSARFLRPMLLGLAACLGAALATGVDSPARAQFFFPFFDNRPSSPPNVRPRSHGLHHGGDSVADLSPRRKPHREKGARADEKKVRPGDANKLKESAKPANATPDAPVVEGPPPLYEPQLLRLSEIMGALAYLQTICSGPAPRPTSLISQAEDTPWRERMENLMTAEGAGPARREKLAGAYNRGLQGYRFSYRVCTPSAELARRRFLDEGARLAHDVSTQFRAN